MAYHPGTSRTNLARINVVGSSGSGKSTFARALAAKLDSPFIELDSLFWKPSWTETADAEFFERISTALAAERWVLDGNYSRSIPVKWTRVTAVVWLDFSFARTLERSLRRAVRRALTREELWPGTGNRESFRRSFLSRQSIILWSIQNFGKTRRQYTALAVDPRYDHVEFIRLRNPTDARTFLDSL